MRVRIVSLLSLAVLLLASCGGKNDFTVIGQFSNMPQQRVVLRELKVADKSLVVDSTKTGADGKFELTGDAAQPGLYQLAFEDVNKYILLSIDKGNIKLAGDWQQLPQNYTVTGSNPSQSLHNFLTVVSSHMEDLQTMNIVFQQLHAQGKDSLIPKATADAQGIKQRLTEYVERYADTTAYLPNALFAVQMLNPKVEQPFITAFLGSLDRRFPNAAQAKDFTAKYHEMLAAQQGGGSHQTFTGEPVSNAAAPEIALQTPEGRELKLSSFRGKYVLVDFWASWCGPCRAENPNVVAAYNKFKDKNFTILGVSLDGDKAKWMEAIQKDGLTWNHVSDLKRWESVAARDYQVESIPANFLIDKEGKIIARDLRGPDLEAKLAEVLK